MIVNFKELHKNYIESNRWQQVRQMVLERDKFRCPCGSKATEVHHHYYMNFNSVDITVEINSCVSLCGECHSEYHSKEV